MKRDKAAISLAVALFVSIALVEVILVVRHHYWIAAAIVGLLIASIYIIGAIYGPRIQSTFFEREVMRYLIWAGGEMQVNTLIEQLESAAGPRSKDAVSGVVNKAIDSLTMKNKVALTGGRLKRIT